MAIRREIVADQIICPKPSGSLKILSPGRITWNERGLIEDISEFPRASLRTLSRDINRVKVLSPGLIDPHTHAAYAGNRAHEWIARLKGATYESIKKKGGGIAFTVSETRAATELDLLLSLEKWTKKVIAAGTTTVEIKSGYGLDGVSELKILRTIKKLKSRTTLTIVPTFMGAHALPRGESESSYAETLITTILPQVSELAQFQDIFCEKGYFSPGWSRRILEAGKKFNLKPKVHAHEFSRSGGVRVAADVGAVSAEHLMHLSSADIALLKKKKIVAVLLPGTSFFLGAKRFAPARQLWDAGVTVALASDYNPGSNPSFNLPLCGTFASVFQGLLPSEVLWAQTLGAARALHFSDRGILEPGSRADFVAWDIDRFEEIYYRYGESRVALTVIGGQKAYSLEDCISG